MKSTATSSKSRFDVGWDQPGTRASRVAGAGPPRARGWYSEKVGLRSPRRAGPTLQNFLVLPKAASAKLPSRSMVSVHGTFHGLAFQATLEPDGQGGHWLKVDRALREAAGAEAGDVVTLEIAPVAEEREPRVPSDLRKALAAAPPGRGRCGRTSRPSRGEIGFTGSSPPGKPRRVRVGSARPATCSPKASDARAASIARGCMPRASVAPSPTTRQCDTRRSEGVCLMASQSAVGRG